VPTHFAAARDDEKGGSVLLMLSGSSRCKKVISGAAVLPENDGCDMIAKKMSLHQCPAWCWERHSEFGGPIPGFEGQHRVLTRTHLEPRVHGEPTKTEDLKTSWILTHFLKSRASRARRKPNQEGKTGKQKRQTEIDINEPYSGRSRRGKSIGGGDIGRRPLQK